MVGNNYHIGRSVPKLVSLTKTAANCEIHRQCMTAIEALIQEKPYRFAELAAKMFQHTHRLVMEQCRRLNYWDAAMEAYDGSLLWK